jgi:hypothetical protein
VQEPFSEKNVELHFSVADTKARRIQNDVPHIRISTLLRNYCKATEHFNFSFPNVNNDQISDLLVVIFK